MRKRSSPSWKYRRSLDANDPFDPEYRRLRYLRYADDFLLGFAGPRAEAEEIKGRLGTFLRDSLKLELSPEKTLITHAGNERARFLGYDIGVINNPAIGNGRGNVVFFVPADKLEGKVAKYMRDGKPKHRAELARDTDFSIIGQYGGEYRGVVQYYAYAANRFWLSRLHWVMRTSLLKTLAAKHRSTVTKMARRYKSLYYHNGRFNACLMATVERPGKEPLIARFGGLRLRPEFSATILDKVTDRDRVPYRSELVERLLAEVCEICGSEDRVQVHHVRKLSDLGVGGRREKPTWMKIMVARRRKTLVVCETCHKAIHAGRPTRGVEGPSAEIHDRPSLESRMLGNLQVRFGGGRMEKGSSPVVRHCCRKRTAKRTPA